MCAFQIPMNMDYDVMTKIGEQVKQVREEEIRQYQVERFEKYAPRFRDSPSALSKNFMKDIVEPVCFGSDPRASLLRMITREPRLRLIRKRWREIGMVGSLPLHTAEAHEERWLRENWC